MRKSTRLHLWKRLLLATVGLCFLAFKAPEKNDLVELSGLLHGRSEAKFRPNDKNRTFDVKAGSRARVVETKYFAQTGNYGICLEILNGSDLPADQKCTWVYYDGKNPNMTLYSVSSNEAERAKKIAKWAQEGKKIQLGNKTKNPQQAHAAEMTRPTKGIVENKVLATTPDSIGIARTAILNIDKTNEVVTKAMNPSTCADCNEAAKLESYAQCNSRNEYLEPTIQSLMRNSNLSPLLNEPQTEVIRKACIQRSLDTYPNFGNGYRTCKLDNSRPSAFAPKACVSKDYVNMTAKSFNLVADCLGDFVSGNPETKRDAALAIFSLTSFESGLHTNAVSPTGAGGIGQFVGEAIQSVNSQLKQVRDHLTKSKNPLCDKILGQSLKQPMSANYAQSCERIALSKDNPLKSMIYTFAFQGAQRALIDKTILQSRLFDGVISKDLPKVERERLSFSLMIWSHNTGGKGMTVPLKALMIQYLQAKKKIATDKDVTQMLTDLRGAMKTHPAAENSGRTKETSDFFQNIQTRVSQITQEPRSCLAN